MMGRIIDLDEISADDAARLFGIARFRLANPELLEDIQRQARESGDDALPEIIEAALDDAHPSEVLKTFSQELIPNRKVLGAFKDQMSASREHGQQMLHDHRTKEAQMTREDPTRLAQIVSEIAHFTFDDEVIVKAAALHAEKCGVDPELARSVIHDAVLALHREGCANVSVAR